jgi:preprotein translocase subunit SecE
MMATDTIIDGLLVVLFIFSFGIFFTIVDLIKRYRTYRFWKKHPEFDCIRLKK